MIIFLLSVWFPCSRILDLHKNENCGLAIFFFFQCMATLGKPLPQFWMYIQILAKLFLKKNYDHIFAKRVVFLL